MILITGGTGAMGHALVNKLVSSGCNVRLLALPGDKVVSQFDSSLIEIRYGDISDSESIKGICENVTTVIHMAAVILSNDPSVYEKVNVGGTAAIVFEALREKVKHFVFISSASVIYPHTTPYSRSKETCEKLVKESGIAWTIIRPTLLYDETGGGEFTIFLNYLKKYPIIPFIGNGKVLKRPVYSKDIVDGLAKVALLEQGALKVYNFSGKEVISLYDFAKYCLVLMGKEHSVIIPVPVWICKCIALILQRVMENPPISMSMIAGLVQDANLDPQDAIRELGYAPSSLFEKLPLRFKNKMKLTNFS
jgi:NADH dehydrogenase